MSFSQKHELQRLHVAMDAGFAHGRAIEAEEAARRAYASAHQAYREFSQKVARDANATEAK